MHDSNCGLQSRPEFGSNSGRDHSRDRPCHGGVIKRAGAQGSFLVPCYCTLTRRSRANLIACSEVSLQLQSVRRIKENEIHNSNRRGSEYLKSRGITNETKHCSIVGTNRIHDDDDDNVERTSALLILFFSSHPILFFDNFI